MSPDPRQTFGYARAPDGAYIAYTTLGDGPIDLVWQFDWFGSLDMVMEASYLATIFRTFASFARVILHDRRGTGLSSRNVDAPDLETRVSDLLAVLDTVGADRPVLGGEREGGTPNILLAASDPERVRSLIWYAPSPRSVWAPDYPWGAKPDYIAREQALLEAWGTPAYGDGFLENEAAVGHNVVVDDGEAGEMRELIAKLSRNTATPDVAKQLSDIWYQTDIRALLASVRVPTLLLRYDDTHESTEEFEYLVGQMSEVRPVVLPGAESDNDFGPFFTAIRDFLGVDHVPDLDTVLTTIVFTDIVDSTALQARLGDRAWKELIEQHHAVVRGHLARFGGQEQDTAGDGFFARFDGPARAIRCAAELAIAVRDLGIQIRVGVHTGECQIADGKCSGLAVSIGARISSLARPSEVLISQTVKDLVAGSGLSFEDAGEHELKGVPDRWRLHRVAE